MAKHKAATEVTVAPLFEKSPIERAVEKYWMPVTGVVLAIVIGIVYRHFSAKQDVQVMRGSWETLASETTPDFMTRLPAATPEAMGGLADRLKGTPAGPWTRLLEIQERLDGKDYDGALSAIAALRAEYPDHALVRDLLPLGDERTTTVDHLEKVARERKAWDEAHPGLFANPPPPEGAPRVRLTTSAGEIVVALYPDKAPAHVENFLKLVREGYYDGTKFHRVVRGFMIQGGDPNSKEEDVTQWGQGGPGYTIPAEPNDLYHFAGVLSAAKKPGDKESSGSQFFLTTDEAHHLDRQHTVFGTVESGLEVVRQIGQAPVVQEGSRDRPQTPVVLEKAEVLE